MQDSLNPHFGVGRTSLGEPPQFPRELGVSAHLVEEPREHANNHPIGRFDMPEGELENCGWLPRSRNGRM
jgi:hypothetical protein